MTAPHAMKEHVCSTPQFCWECLTDKIKFLDSQLRAADELAKAATALSYAVQSGDLKKALAAYEKAREDV